MPTVALLQLSVATAERRLLKREGRPTNTCTGTPNTAMTITSTTTDKSQRRQNRLCIGHCNHALHRYHTVPGLWPLWSQRSVCRRPLGIPGLRFSKGCGETVRLACCCHRGNTTAAATASATATLATLLLLLQPLLTSRRSQLPRPYLSAVHPCLQDEAASSS